MKFVIISDIHSNIQALFRADETFGNYDKLISLGDIVGYGPNPSECIDWVRKNADISLMGNHDSALCDISNSIHFNINARQAIDINFNMINEEQRRYLCNLPLKEEFNDIVFVHASPSKPEAWEYILGEEKIFYTLKFMKGKFLFIGHSHIPFIAEYKNGSMFIAKNTISIKPDARYLINVGSVGQPRDGDNRLSYSFFDSTRKVIEIRRFNYDYKKTQESMKGKDLPNFLIERLEHGE